MSRKGNCLDNALFDQLKQSIHQYIDFYNNERIKSLSPKNHRRQTFEIIYLTKVQLLGFST